MNNMERDVYVLTNTYKEPIEMVQGTNGIPLIFYFRDYDIPTGTTASVFIQKPSGKAIQTAGAVSVNEDSVTVNTTTQMTAEVGESILQMQLMLNGKNIFTFNHPLTISKSAIPVNSENGSSFIDECIERLETATAKAETATDESKAATESSKKTTEEMKQKAQNGEFSATVNAGSTITGEPGTMAAVRNSGTAKDAVFDFTIPRGMPGVSTSLSPGIFEMYVNDSGHLMLRHNDNEPVPPLTIQDGRLIYTLS